MIGRVLSGTRPNCFSVLHFCGGRPSRRAAKPGRIKSGAPGLRPTVMLNPRSSGEPVTLIYPVMKCVCGWSPGQAVRPQDASCQISSTNPKVLSETVREKLIRAQAAEATRRGGFHCRVLIQVNG